MQPGERLIELGWPRRLNKLDDNFHLLWIHSLRIRENFGSASLRISWCWTETT